MFQKIVFQSVRLYVLGQEAVVPQEEDPVAVGHVGGRAGRNRPAGRNSRSGHDYRHSHLGRTQIVCTFQDRVQAQAQRYHHQRRCRFGKWQTLFFSTFERPLVCKVIRLLIRTIVVECLCKWSSSFEYRDVGQPAFCRRKWLRQLKNFENFVIWPRPRWKLKIKVLLRRSFLDQSAQLLINFFSARYLSPSGASNIDPTFFRRRIHRSVEEKPPPSWRWASGFFSPPKDRYGGSFWIIFVPFSPLVRHLHIPAGWLIMRAAVPFNPIVDEFFWCHSISCELGDLLSANDKSPSLGLNVR